MKILVCTLLIALCAISAMAADVSGKWSGTFTREGQDPSNVYMVLKQTGSTLTGTGGPDEGEQWPIANGKVEGGKISGEVTSTDGAVYKLNLVLEGDHLKGEVTATRDGQTMKAKVDATRVKS
jgi:hypothetical protein